MSKRFAPEGAVWVCSACGKVSDYDSYGIEGRHDAGWDESCALNAVLCDASTLEREGGIGRVTRADAIEDAA